MLLHAEPSTMIARHTITLGLAATSGLLALSACREDRDHTGRPGSSDTMAGTTSAAMPPADAPVADSSGGPPDTACLDDYHGNQSHETALDLALDTTDTAFVVLGDALAANPPELGDDELAVCSAAPSDFFTFMAECPGYLSVEARELDNGVPELLLYDPSIAQGGPPLEQALGTWFGFFLEPIQRPLDEGSFVIEVRLRRGLDRQRYSLTVAWLPESPCPA
jgi:hypothetical protein